MHIFNMQLHPFIKSYAFRNIKTKESARRRIFAEMRSFMYMEGLLPAAIDTNACVRLDAHNVLLSKPVVYLCRERSLSVEIIPMTLLI
jgi:hypothetical protein